jgi:hypothetical protein
MEGERFRQPDVCRPMPGNVEGEIGVLSIFDPPSQPKVHVL